MDLGQVGSSHPGVMFQVVSSIKSKKSLDRPGASRIATPRVAAGAAVSPGANQ